jgi:signal recognition particle subunit SRP54
MGDVVGLVKEFERHVDLDKAEGDAERMFRGQFDLTDFVEQIKVLRKMGSLEDLFAKMPMFQEGMPDNFRPDEREFLKITSVYDSMTPHERRRPASLREGNRIARVAKGSGRPAQHVIDVLSKFDTMRRMMIALGDQPSLLSKLPGFEQVAQVRKLRGLDLAELFGDAFDVPKEEEAEEEDDELDEAAPKDEKARREYFANLKKAPPAKKLDKSKEKKKKKAAAKARKKNRR